MLHFTVDANERRHGGWRKWRFEESEFQANCLEQFPATYKLNETVAVAAATPVVRLSVLFAILYSASVRSFILDRISVDG